MCKHIVLLFYPWHGHASHAIVDLIEGENKGAPRFAQSYAFDMGLLLHSHSNPASKILLASSRSRHFCVGILYKVGALDGTC